MTVPMSTTTTTTTTTAAPSAPAAPTTYIVPIGSGRKPVRDLVRLTAALRQQGITVPAGDGVALQNLPGGGMGYLVQADSDPTAALRNYVEQPTAAEQQAATWQQQVQAFAAVVDSGTAPTPAQAAQAVRALIGLLAPVLAQAASEA